jgi:hypothetical protein
MRFARRALLALCAAALLRVSALNLLANPSFEDASGGAPSVWATYADVAASSTRLPHSGARGANLTSTDPSTFGILYQRVYGAVVAPGAVYSVSAWARGGGWDEYLRYHNEHSLFLRLNRTLRAGEHLVYDPEARMIIRRDVPGGLDHRTEVDCRERIDTLAKYYFWLVAREHPLRIYGALPVFLPYFVLDAGIHAAELAEHTQASLVRQFVDGALYAPKAAWKHLRSGPPRT